MLCCPRRLPRSRSRRLAGGERRSLSRTAASITKSLARARGCSCNGGPRTAWPENTATDRLPAKLLINTWWNAIRYAPLRVTAIVDRDGRSGGLCPYRCRPGHGAKPAQYHPVCSESAVCVASPPSLHTFASHIGTVADPRSKCQLGGARAAADSCAALRGSWMRLTGYI